MAGRALTLRAEAYASMGVGVWGHADHPDMYVRACYADMDRIGVEPGGTVEIAGAGRALARCVPAAPLSPARRILVPRSMLGALGVDNGDAVMIRGIRAPAARSVTLAPLGPVPRAGAGYLAGKLLGVPVVEGAALAVRYFEDESHRVRFQVAGVSPAGGPAVVSARTDVRVAESGRRSRAVPPVPAGMPRRLAADAGMIGAALGPLLEGRAPAAAAPGGAVCEAGYARACFLVRAAAGARGAHLAEINASALRWAAASPGRRGRAREHARKRAEDPGPLRRILESHGFEEVRWEPPAPEVAFFRDEARRTLEAAAARAPSVVLLDILGMEMGRPARGGAARAAPGTGSGLAPPRARDPASLLASLVGGMDPGCRMALVMLSGGPGTMPEWLAGRAVEVAVTHGLRRPGRRGSHT